MGWLLKLLILLGGTLALCKKTCFFSLTCKWRCLGIRKWCGAWNLSLNTLHTKKGSVGAVVGEDRWLLKQGDGYIEWGGVFCALQSCVYVWNFSLRVNEPKTNNKDFWRACTFHNCNLFDFPDRFQLSSYPLASLDISRDIPFDKTCQVQY